MKSSGMSASVCISGMVARLLSIHGCVKVFDVLSKFMSRWFWSVYHTFFVVWGGTLSMIVGKLSTFVSFEWVDMYVMFGAATVLGGTTLEVCSVRLMYRVYRIVDV